MKRRTLLVLETGLTVAAVSLVVAINSLRAADETGDKAAQETAAASEIAAPEAHQDAAPESPPVVPALTPAPLKTSPGMDEIFQLARSGVAEEILVAYIEKSGKSYYPSVEEILYLKDLGVAPGAIAKLIRTGNQESELARKIEEGSFESLEPDPQVNTATSEPPAPEHYAAAPQPLENGPVADVSAEATTQVDLQYFKTSLGSYGTWIRVDGYGDCWRPTVAIVNSDWRPYYDSGRWIYTNSGWYWLSDYSWGWAPFHYGRWLRHGHWGWVWVPGYNWGPAWVEWRTTSAYCGWAPLPPLYGSGIGFSYWGGSWGFSIGWNYYNWVPYRYCYGYYPRHYAPHHGQHRDIYNNSTVIQPTIVGNNNTVIVTGPDATVVANAGHREIKRVDIRDVGRPGSGGTGDYLENGGRTLAAYRPTVRPDRSRPETELANRRAEFRRPSVTLPDRAAAPDADASDSRNIVLRGGAAATGGNNSYSAWRDATQKRSPASATQSRTAGQNTTIVSRPEYRRPASEATPLLRDSRSLSTSRPTVLGDPAIGGGNRSESSRSTRYWTAPGSRTTFESSPRQTLTIPERRYNPIAQPGTAASTAPARPSGFERNPSSFSQPTGGRNESTRGRPPTISPSVVPPAVSRPAPMRPSSSSPSIAPSSRPAFSPPSSSSTFSRPASPAPSRSFSVPASRPSAPARSFSAPASSPAPSRSSSPSSGGGGRSNGPTRRQN